MSSVSDQVFSLDLWKPQHENYKITRYSDARTLAEQLGLAFWSPSPFLLKNVVHELLEDLISSPLPMQSLIAKAEPDRQSKQGWGQKWGGREAGDLPQRKTTVLTVPPSRAAECSQGWELDSPEWLTQYSTEHFLLALVRTSRIYFSFRAWRKWSGLTYWIKMLLLKKREK